jgi:hypothetical protein
MALLLAEKKKKNVYCDAEDMNAADSIRHAAINSDHPDQAALGNSRCVILENRRWLKSIEFQPNRPQAFQRHILISDKIRSEGICAIHRFSRAEQAEKTTSTWHGKTAQRIRTESLKSEVGLDGIS